MGKNSVVRFPPAPTQPIKVQSRYDKYFRRRLRRAIQDDFERFTGGLPTYHAYLISVVSRHAKDVVSVDGMSKEDLRNFLNGMASHTPRIALLDAYVQITQPELRPTFFPNKDAERTGMTFGDYFESPGLQGYGRAQIANRLVGNFEFVRTKPPRPMRKAPRLLAIRLEASTTYLRIYEFSTPFVTDHRDGPDRQLLGLFTGYCIPQERAPILLMRSYGFRSRRIGRIDLPDQNETTPASSLSLSFTDISDLSPDYRSEIYEFGDLLEGVDGRETWKCTVNRLKSPLTDHKFSEFIENLQEVY